MMIRVVLGLAVRMLSPAEVMCKILGGTTICSRHAPNGKSRKEDNCKKEKE